jgi:hypothetical protein
MGGASTARVTAFRNRQRHGLAIYRIELDEIAVIEMLTKAKQLDADKAGDHREVEHALQNTIAIICKENQE